MTYNAQFNENYIIESLPAKATDYDSNNQCIVYKHEIVIFNASRHPSYLLSCNINFVGHSVQNDLEEQFPILFSPNEAQKFVFYTYIPYRYSATEPLPSIQDLIERAKPDKPISLEFKSGKKTYGCSIPLDTDSIIGVIATQIHPF